MAALAKTARAKQLSEIAKLEQQLSRTYDLLEQGVYTPDVFAARKAELSARIADARETHRQINTPKKDVNDDIILLVPKLRNVLMAYSSPPIPWIKTRCSGPSSIASCTPKPSAAIATTLPRITFRWKSSRNRPDFFAAIMI
jgi:hypothetical protein